MRFYMTLLHKRGMVWSQSWDRSRWHTHTVPWIKCVNLLSTWRLSASSHSRHHASNTIYFTRTCKWISLCHFLMWLGTNSGCMDTPPKIYYLSIKHSMPVGLKNSSESFKFSVMENSSWTQFEFTAVPKILMATQRQWVDTCPQKLNLYQTDSFSTSEL